MIYIIFVYLSFHLEEQAREEHLHVCILQDRLQRRDVVMQEQEGRFLSFQQMQKDISVPVISPKICISKSNVWNVCVLSRVAARQGTGEWNVKGHAQP